MEINGRNHHNSDSCFNIRLDVLLWVLANTRSTRFVLRITLSLCNLTGTSAAMLMCMSNFIVILLFKLSISRLRCITRTYDKTPYRILKRGPGRKGKIWCCVQVSHNDGHVFQWEIVVIPLYIDNNPDGIFSGIGKTNSVTKIVLLHHPLWEMRVSCPQSFKAFIYSNEPWKSREYMEAR